MIPYNDAAGTETNHEQAFSELILAWFRALAVGDWARACGMIDEPNSYGITWNRALIEGVLADNYGPNSVFSLEHPQGPKFCLPEEVAAPRRVERPQPYSDGSGFYLDHEVPLNGAWSDLMAEFEFHRRPGGFAVVLHDLHVM